MTKTVFMFPGQGAQAVGMGKSLYENFEGAKNVFDAACDILNKDIKKLCFEGPEELLKETINTQSCLLTVSLAAYSAFIDVTDNSIKPDFALGHSLGEYGAYFVAGVMDLENTLLAIQKRSDVMQQACQMSEKGAMAAILGLDVEIIKETLDEASKKGLVSIANYNDTMQTVITGVADAVEYACSLIKEKGAKRIVPLAVSGGFHSKLMQSATDSFVDFVNTLKINDSNIPVVTNLDSEFTTKADDFREKMPLQISNSVMWYQSIKKLVNEGADTFIEFGSGRVLSGLNRKICPEVKTCNIADLDSLNSTKEALSLLNV